MKNGRFYTLILIACFLIAPSGYADQKMVSHGVTIKVPPAISLFGSQSDLDFAFNGNKAGEETNEVTVEYSVFANALQQADGANVLTATLDNRLSDMDFQASVGAYSKTSGDTELVPAQAGYVTVQDSETSLAVKSGSVGSGQLLKGTLPVTYKAVATSDLPSGTKSQRLTITLTDV